LKELGKDLTGIVGVLREKSNFPREGTSPLPLGGGFVVEGGKEKSFLKGIEKYPFRRGFL